MRFGAAEVLAKRDQSFALWRLPECAVSRICAVGGHGRGESVGDEEVSCDDVVVEFAPARARFEPGTARWRPILAAGTIS